MEPDTARSCNLVHTDLRYPRPQANSSCDIESLREINTDRDFLPRRRDQVIEMSEIRSDPEGV